MNSDCAAVMRQMTDKYWGGYPPHIREAIIVRNSFEFDLLLSRIPRGSTVCDVGGGWGAFACCAAAMGMESILMDDFGDPGVAHHDDPRHQLPQEYGVQVIRRDVIRDGIDFPDNSIDAFTSFDVLEHLPASPKKMLHQMMQALRPGGVLLVGVPNCVNLRKRLTVPLGKGKWSAMDEWYEKPVFRSHVREPDLDDLLYIARDLKLKNVEVRGANFAGYENSRPLIRQLTRLIDALLRLRPSLCSSLYLIGEKSA